MSKSFFEALAAMRSDNVAENPDFAMPVERIYDDVMELAARMGFEAKAAKPDPQDWDGQGLPPVGWVGELSYADIGWLQGEVVGAHNGLPVFATKYGYYSASVFRPLRTERDRAIDEMMKVAPSSECVDEALFKPRMTKSEREFAGSIYDAGMYKQESES